MRKIFLLLPFILAFVFVPRALAQDTKTPQITSLAKDVTVNRDHFAAGEVVEILGTVNGDTYIAGGQVTIDGNINGDLLVAGGQVKISGKISGNVRAAGGQINVIGAQIGKNLTVVGGSLDFDKTTKLAGSLVAAGGNITINTDVGRDISVAASNIVIGSNVKRDVDAAGESIRLSSAAFVGGTVNYWSQNPLVLDNGAKVTGKQIKHDLPVGINKNEFSNIQAQAGKSAKILGNAFSLIGLISFAIIGLIMAKLFPAFSVNTVENLKKNPWKTALIGFVWTILTPLILVFMLITIIGAPLALILFPLYFIFMSLGKYFVMLFVGEFILTKLNQKQTIYLSFLTGLLFFSILCLIPVLGGITKLAFFLFGFGALLKQINITLASGR